MAVDNHILTITEPTIELEELLFGSFDEESGSSKTSSAYGDAVPFIHVNGYTFKDSDIISFELNMQGIIPTLNVNILDSRNQFSADTFPRDGDVLSIRIASKQTDTFKDIRMDFDIDSVSGPNTSTYEKAQGAKFSFTGSVKIPGLYAEECKAYEPATSLDHIEQIATELKLGLATNVDASDDMMKLVTPYQPLIDTLGNLVDHSYVGEESFQIYCIDPYYYINFVDVNALLNSPEDFETTFSNFTQSFDETPEDEDDKLERELVLTNHEKSVGTTMHIKKFSLKQSSGGEVKKNGYKRVLQFFENDALTREESFVNFDVEPLSSTEMKDIEEPLKGRRGEDRYQKEIKYKYEGRKPVQDEQDGANTHLNFEFAKIHNVQNLTELKKMQLEIVLAKWNAGLHKYQKLPIAIYSESMTSIGAMDDLEVKKGDSGFDAAEQSEESETSRYEAKLDNFLTGFYVIGGITYMYSSQSEEKPVIQQKITLLRREWPTRMNNIEEAVNDSPPEPTPPPPEPTPEPTPEPEPEEVVEEIEEEEEENVLTVTPTSPMSFTVVEDADSSAKKINIKGTNLGIYALSIYMPGNDIYFDFLHPGETVKNYGNRDWSFSASDFPNLPEGEVDIDIEVYVEEAYDEGDIGNIEITGGSDTVKIPINVKLVPA